MVRLVFYRVMVLLEFWLAGIFVGRPTVTMRSVLKLLVPVKVRSQPLGFALSSMTNAMRE
jgi:hypothetical protein